MELTPPLKVLKSDKVYYSFFRYKLSGSGPSIEQMFVKAGYDRRIFRGDQGLV